MNIESVLYKINLFEDLVFASGFKRDINDYFQLIQQPQNRSIVLMKELSSKLQKNLIDINNNALNSELKLIIKDTIAFTELNTISQLEVLDADPTIDAGSYYQQFNIILTHLFQAIDNNKTELDNVNVMLSKYVPDSSKYETEANAGIISLIFKDLQTVGNLKEFSKALSRWNRTLLFYHSLLKSESPKEINLLEIQNGSIDVIFNIDLDVAIDLTGLMKTGMQVYGAYLLYKSKIAKEIILSYMGNKKLIEGEEERGELMLDNIKDSVKKLVHEQHKKRLKEDKKIDKTSIDVKIEEISQIITDHIIKGNEMKFLNPPIVELPEEGPEEGSEEIKDIGTELRIITALTREYYKKLNADQKQLLLDKYIIKDDDIKKE